MFFRLGLALGAYSLLSVSNAWAESQFPIGGIGMYGAPGLIDTPTADSTPDGQITLTFSGFSDFNKSAVAFQIAPRLTTVLRYSGLSNYTNSGARVLDRSFDLHYQLVTETDRRPAIAIGLRDFMGTSIYSAQYLVATKTIHPNLRTTVGLGWGRLSKTNTLQPLDTGNGGVPAFDQWFRGPVGVFGGIEWQTPVRGLTAKLEYSTDLYTRENNSLNAPTLSAGPSFNRKTDINLGLNYLFKNGASMELSYLHGDQFGIRFTSFVNPKTRNPGYFDRAPVAIEPRTRPLDQSTDWLNQQGIVDRARQQLDDLLAVDGTHLLGLSLTADRAQIWIENRKYIATAQAIGRATRALARVMPDSVAVFEITLVSRGLSLSTTKIDRAGFERATTDPNEPYRIGSWFKLQDPTPLSAAEVTTDHYPKFSWSWGPYAQINFSDFNDQFGIDGGIRLRGRVHLSPALSFGGAVTKSFESDKSAPTNVTTLPRVRSDLGLYNQMGDPALESLTLDYHTKLNSSIYGRLSIGYLERMFGGVSGELLYKPVHQNWAVGVELNAVRQRDFYGKFGFQNYQTITGHVSGYFDLGQGYGAELDLGRYLAGDWGGTVRFERAFENGWRVGAFATITNVPAASFGEGSFDKGIYLSIPVSTISGVPTKAKFNTGFRSVNSDGGARLRLDGRLYKLIREGHFRRVSGSFGRFWQ